jgi:hypothetical protein
MNTPSLIRRSPQFFFGQENQASKFFGALVMMALLLCPRAEAVQVLSKAPNVAVYLGLPFSQLEFENPLSGNEAIFGHPVLEWRDADYTGGLPPGYDDWTVSHPGEIDGNANEIWMRRNGHSISTATTVRSTMVSIHLVGDNNDGLAQVLVDGVEVAQLNMDTASPPSETALILVKGLANTPHTIVVNDLGVPAGGLGTDVATLGAAALGESPLKWVQPPVPAAIEEPVFNGWNEPSLYGGQWIAADDWVCTSTNPVTVIRWWGSFLGWTSPEPPPVLPQAYSLCVWTDVPADPTEPGSFSHPGVVLRQIICANFSMRFVGWDLDPRTKTYEACFLFEQHLRPEEWFTQDPGPTGTNIFWLSIAAMYPGQITEFPWGWKTRPRDPTSPAPDDAVRVFAPTTPEPGMQYGTGRPIFWPEPSESWDLAFELMSVYTPTVTKWEQVPDLSLQGIDVRACVEPQPPLVLADDYQCTTTGPVTDISVWGSWRRDQFPGDPGNVIFTLSLHSDIPARQSPTGYSMPGDVLWTRTFEPGQFTWEQMQLLGPEGWLEPPSGYEPIGDYNCVRYDFQIPEAEAYVQRGMPLAPVVYWLDVQARVLAGPVLTQFGWKSCATNWNDDAVWILGFEPILPGRIWNELRYPAAHPRAGKSMDLAFRIGMPGEPVAEKKWSQPPVPATLQAFNGWNEPSIFGSSQIVADDWVCTNAQPVTDLHWWGSFVGFGGQPEQVGPIVPDAFHITIWTDVPAGVDARFSHPGKVIWEVFCRDFTFHFVGWDVDPRNPTAPPEACFKFEQELLPAEWFWQDSGKNIYWVSIAAIYQSGTSPNYPWGWKTRPRDPNSLAPDDAVRIFVPTAPASGSLYMQGAPIEFPAGTSWDMAFALSTRTIPEKEDFGDAPDPTYPTLAINNGARHALGPNVLFLGNQVDGEPNGQPDPNALGDDNSGLADEDGVTFTSALVPGQAATLTVQASGAGFLSVWVDFGGNGSWAEAGDKIFGDVSLNPGLNPLSFVVPLNATPGRTFARFRFSSFQGLSYTGPARDGEVEDYSVRIDEAKPEADLGDAPDSSNSFPGLGMTAYPSGGPPGVPANFPTVYQIGSPPCGPIHLQPTAVAFLGASVTREMEADLGPDQDGVNNLMPPLDISDMDGRDDGVLFPLVLPHCLPTTFQYQITVNGPPPPNNTLFVNVWFDWNRDGDWDDTMQCQAGTPPAPEWAVQNQLINIPAGPPTPFVMTLTTPRFVPWHRSGGQDPDPIWMRITLSEQQWPPPSPIGPVGGEGPAQGYLYGETEDYYVKEYQTELLDFGDAPDPRYPTSLASNGARHLLVPGFFLGNLIDPEPDGLPHPQALGDDNSNLADEDGVVWVTPLVPGQAATVNVTASAAGVLNAWLDFNADGDWADPGEQIAANLLLAAGPNALNFAVPWGAIPGQTFARFRFSHTRGLSFNGIAPDGTIPDGEVEDYTARIESLPEPEADLGDAPDSSNTIGVPMYAYPPGGPGGIIANYPTVYQAGSPPYGPIHQNPNPIVFLGAGISLEMEADVGPDQDGVNNIQPATNTRDLDQRDDGVVFPLALPNCSPTVLQYQITVLGAPPTDPFYVNVWFDWNRDGDWDDAVQCPTGLPTREWAVQNQQVFLGGIGPYPKTITLLTPPFTPYHPAAAGGPIWMRITLSEQLWSPVGPGLRAGGDGPAQGYRFGETEDYYVREYEQQALDFGDAPDPRYPTLRANNGARHLLVPGFLLGNLIDPEPDGLPHPQALGDDNSNLADEDGVAWVTPLVPGQAATVNVTASAAGVLNAWLDFNADGDWADPGEHIFADQPLVAGPNALGFPVPWGATAGQTFARFRFSHTRGLSFDGVAPDGTVPDGEVEDYAVRIEPLPEPEADLGDAPDSSNTIGRPMTAYPLGGPGGVPANYPTVFAAGSPPFGPIHLRPLAVAFLGNGVTLETEADVGLDQDGPNNIQPASDTPDQDGRDDGVLFPLRLPHCLATRFQYLVTCTGPNPVPLFVNVWFDWNRDGDWNDLLGCPDGSRAAEWAVQNQPVNLPGPGLVVMTTPNFQSWHPSLDQQPIWMRITLSEQLWPPAAGVNPIGGEGPANGYLFGETEDYYIKEYEVSAEHDFGDAPDPTYPTLLPNGAWHGVIPGFHLGQLEDAEPNGLPDPNALGDDRTNLPDEDGVVWRRPPLLGVQGCVDVTLLSGPAGGLLDAWVDLDRSGSWEPGEHVLVNQLLSPGVNPNLCFPVPATATLGPSFARFRLSSGGFLAPGGPALDGEVEDYSVTIVQRRPNVAIVITNIVVTNVVVGTVTNQVVTVEWTAENGIHYQLQGADTLDNSPPTTWSDVGPEVIGPGHSQTETNSPPKPKRFYQVIAPYVWP